MSKYSQNIPPSIRGAIEWFYDDIQEGKSLLDFGCSTGYFGKFIKESKHCTVYGVEISEDKEEARKVLDGVYSFDLDGEWPSKVYERQYEYLFFGDVLEHLKDPGRVLEKSRKLLKKNGKIFVSTPNIAHMSIRLELMGGNFEYEPMGILDNTHLKYFTLRSFTQMAVGAGYAVREVDFTANDYSNDVIKKLLAKSGLAPTEKFWKIADSLEARAFQYKFVLVPYTQKSQKTLMPAVTKPEQVRNATVADLNDQVTNLRRHAEAQAKIIADYADKAESLKKQNGALAHKLERIEGSRFYRVVRTVLRHPKK